MVLPLVNVWFHLFLNIKNNSETLLFGLLPLKLYLLQIELKWLFIVVVQQEQIDSLYCCCSVAKLCPTPCNTMDYKMPGFPVLHYLPEFAQTHVHWVSWCHPTISSSVIPFPSCLQSFPASESFPMSWLFSSGGQSIRASVTIEHWMSVLPMNIQDWFPLGLTGVISLLSKGLSRVFSSTKVLKHQLFSTQRSLEPKALYWAFTIFHTFG